ncbi:MAG: hypothetical protein HY903_11825 [Deltaproteobacteria bacterium]|nr:hypothetical protein [Deltaproteobacteria bacterium]
MHAFFELLAGMVNHKRVATGAREGAILFELTGLHPESFRVELSTKGCTTSTGHGPAELTVWASRSQLDKMMSPEGPIGPLRVAGDRSLFDSLASVATPGLSGISVRLRGGT